MAPKSLEPKVASGLGLGIWTSLVYFTSGSLAISSRAGIVCHVVANLVMFTISALSGLGLLVYSCLLEARGAHDTRWGAPSVLLALVGAVMMVAGAASAALTCRPLCAISTIYRSSDLVEKQVAEPEVGLLKF